jgi:hypothetical protein
MTAQTTFSDLAAGRKKEPSEEAAAAVPDSPEKNGRKTLGDRSIAALTSCVADSARDSR